MFDCIDQGSFHPHLQPEHKKHPTYFEEFCKECIRNETNGTIRGLVLYERFTDWYEIHYMRNIPQHRVLFDFVSKYYKNDKSVTKDGNNWHGLSLIDFEIDLI